jgi:ribonuclease P protein component
VKRRFRLSRSSDFQRVRRFGKSYAHPLIVLFVSTSEASNVRVGVAAGTRVGNAVQRNRAKRLMRAAMRSLLPKIAPNVDLVLVARSPLPTASLHQTESALHNLLTRAGLLSPDNDG